MPTFTADQLKNLGFGIFKAAGASDEEAEMVSQHLVNANLAGHDSHGVIRIPAYVMMIKVGYKPYGYLCKIVPGSEIEIVKETETTALIDGHWGFGQVIATKAMQLAIEKAEKSGIGAVGVLHCNHIGRVGEYSMMAAEKGLVGVSMCNSGRLVAPFGSMERIMSTNPIAVAIPSGSERPFLLDMATSVHAEGKVRVRRNRGESLPDGWIIDKEGTPSNNPEDLYAGGAILPLGRDVGYKGFGLAMIVDILGGALTGHGCTSGEEYIGGNGTFVMAIKIGNFVDPKKFKSRVDELIQNVKKSKKAPNVEDILIPGEPEMNSREERLANGIFVSDKTWEDIKKTAGELDVDAENLVK
jgi:uncharacterized oxidoreductase